MNLTNEQKAAAVLQSIVSGDVTAAKKHLNPTKYIQHNLSFPDGASAIIGAIESGMLNGTTIESARVLSDGDFVVLQSEYGGTWNGGNSQIIIDVFRFEEGLIVEHWDNAMPLESKPNPSGRTQLDGTTTVTDLDKTEANKALAKGYISTVLVNGEFNKVHDFVDGDNYMQHHPNIGDGISGLSAALEQFAKQGIHMVYEKIHAVHGQGNFALVMSNGKFADNPFAFFDLLRLQDNKVAEHWGIMAQIPPKSEWKNDNGKF